MTVGVRHSEMGALLGFAERQLYVYKRYWVWEVVWL
ncbi:MAG: ABC transporter permease, partial [Chloroflexi bacterium]